jgi:preprotein translocase SecE subunit
MQESYVELRKVSWPSRQTTIQYTIIVAVSSVLAGVLVGGLDFLLTFAFEKIII